LDVAGDFAEFPISFRTRPKTDVVGIHPNRFESNAVPVTIRFHLF
jgi:hypothetical protein